MNELSNNVFVPSDNDFPDFFASSTSDLSNDMFERFNSSGQFNRVSSDEQLSALPRVASENSLEFLFDTEEKEEEHSNSWDPNFEPEQQEGCWEAHFDSSESGFQTGDDLFDELRAEHDETAREALPKNCSDLYKQKRHRLRRSQQDCSKRSLGSNVVRRRATITHVTPSPSLDVHEKEVAVTKSPRKTGRRMRQMTDLGASFTSFTVSSGSDGSRDSSKVVPKTPSAKQSSLTQSSKDISSLKDFLLTTSPVKVKKSNLPEEKPLRRRVSISTATTHSNTSDGSLSTAEDDVCLAKPNSNFKLVPIVRTAARSRKQKILQILENPIIQQSVGVPSEAVCSEETAVPETSATFTRKALVRTSSRYDETAVKDAVKKVANLFKTPF